MVGLKVSNCSFGFRAKDAIDVAGIEAEAAEALLEIGDVVAPRHRGAEVEHPVTEPICGLDQRVPRVAAYRTILHDAATGLEGAHRFDGFLVELFGIATRKETGCCESTVKVADRASFVSFTQW